MKRSKLTQAGRQFGTQISFPKPPFSLQDKSRLLEMAFRGGSFAGQGFFNSGSPHPVGCMEALEQPIRTYFKELRQASKCGHRDGVITVFDMPNRLPMHACQFGQTLLRHVGSQPGQPDVMADQPQNLFVRHRA